MNKTLTIIACSLLIQQTLALTYEGKSLGEVYKVQMNDTTTRAMAYEVSKHE